MNCREFIEFLDEYLSSTLSVAQRAEFDEHLAECADCVHYLENYRKTLQLVKRTFPKTKDGPPPADAPEELIQAILKARLRQK